MLTRMLLLSTILGVGLVLLSGAWPGPVASPQPNADSAFLVQSFPLDVAIIGTGVSANDLLEKALEKLDWKRTTWLHTKIRQTMFDPESRFTAKGFLQRGPNHCAHLEMNILSNGSQARLLIVSDGATIVTVRDAPGVERAVTLHPLPEGEDAHAKNEFLLAMNCNGPVASLREALSKLRDAKLQTGLLRDRRVIQVSGEIAHDGNGGSVSIPVRSCSIYLDAATLWPCQIEWFGCDARERAIPLMRVEYADPEFNRELSLAECERLFSYQP